MPGDTVPLNNIENELIIGLIGGLGVDFNEVSSGLTHELKRAGYHIEIIKISDKFAKRKNPSKFSETYWKMQYGTKQRQLNGNDYWAKQAVESIFYARPELSKKYTKIAYIIRSLKNREEIELLSGVYGRNFIAIATYCDGEASKKSVIAKNKLSRLKLEIAQQEMQEINRELALGPDYIEPNGEDILLKFLQRKDQEETHPELKSFGQNIFKCYASANYFLYQNQNLSRQIKRCVELIFNDPFAEPTFEEYFMFCAQAAAYRSLDLDRQIGAVIVNQENELVASGFNDVSKVGGGHFSHHDHPMSPKELLDDQRDFKQEVDYNHKFLDQLANRMKQKLHLDDSSQAMLRDEFRSFTEFKRSTHAEMSAILDAARRGVAVRDCTMYVNTYPCHNCTKHIMASGIKKVIFLSPYTKSKAAQMYENMIVNGVNISNKDETKLVFEPFLGASPNRYMLSFANDKDSRIEKLGGKETGRPQQWLLRADSIPTKLIQLKPHSYIPREWSVVHGRLPDMSGFYK